VRRIAVDAALMTASALGAHAIAGGRPGAAGSTVPFVTLTTAQLLYALACRSESRPALDGLSQNPALIGALAGTLALQVGAVTVPALRRLLGTSPLGAGAWGVVAAGALVPLLTREALGTKAASTRDWQLTATSDEPISTCRGSVRTGSRR
jgi:Ca2+-transporting ATPase